MKTVQMTPAEFKDLPEYSCSIPTGKTIGKRWRRGEPYHGGPEVVRTWYVGEYYTNEELEKAGRVGIAWALIEVTE